MTRISLKLKLFVPVFALTLAFDQWTKQWILERFSYGEEQVVLPGFFNLTHVRNPGGAFSFLATLPEEIRQSFFLGTGLLAIVLLLVFLRRIEPRDWLAATAIGGVLGGAIGNLTDRIRYGEVIDFLDFRLIGGYVWPTFNLADCWIVVGVVLLMCQMFFEPEPSSAAGGLDPALPSEASGGSTS
jgi:signal peptidase II